jgi:hypothetical protein
MADALALLPDGADDVELMFLIPLYPSCPAAVPCEFGI